jgi:hypothetical protein
MQRISVEALHESELYLLTNVESSQSPIPSWFNILPKNIPTLAPAFRQQSQDIEKAV